MSLKIRMARAGTKKRPFYHIVVADTRSPRDGRFIERLGYFNPLLPKDNKERLKLDFEKVKAWLAKGAQPSDRIMRFLDAAGIRARPSATIRKRRSRARSARRRPKPRPRLRPQRRPRPRPRPPPRRKQPLLRRRSNAVIPGRVRDTRTRNPSHDASCPCT